MLMALGHPDASKGTANQMRQRLVSRITAAALNTEFKIACLFIDEAYLMTSGEFTWLCDLYNELNINDIQLTAILVSTKEILAVKKGFIQAGKQQIVQRLMLKEAEFHGIESLADLMVCMNALDNNFIPRGHDRPICLSENYFPDAHKDGKTLASFAADFWAAVQNLRTTKHIHANYLTMKCFMDSVSYCLRKYGAQAGENRVYAPSIADDQKKGTRPIDIMLNDDIRQQIERQVLINCDRVSVIDILECSRFTKELFHPVWNEGVFQTLRECVSNQAFTAARKVATIMPDAMESLKKDLVDGYLENEVVPRLLRRRNYGREDDPLPITDDEIAHEMANLKQHWDQKLMIDYQEILFLRIHKEYISLCKHLDQLFEGSWHVDTVDSMENSLNFYFNGLEQSISLCSVNNSTLGRVPILYAILEDFFTHTAAVLGDLMAGKRCLTGGASKGIYDTFFYMPASQYIAIWKAENIELWACDPNIAGLLSNIEQVKECFDKTGRLEKPPVMAQV